MNINIKNLTREQITDLIADLKAQIEAFEATPEAWPQRGDRYWTLYSDGNIHESRWDDNNDLALDQLAMGSVYRTQDEAEHARDVQLAIVRVNNVIREKYPFEADWGDCNQPKGIVCNDGGKLDVGTFYTSDYKCPIIPINLNNRVAILAECEDDLRLIFGVTK